MKTKSTVIIALLALGASAWVLTAQDNGGRPDGQRPPRRQNLDNQGGPGGPGMRNRQPIPPVIHALDANHDGVVDTDEIANAPAALRKLDRNDDGKLTMNEMMPPPQGMGGPGNDNQGPNDGEGRPPRRNGGPNRPGGPPQGDQ